MGITIKRHSDDLSSFDSRHGSFNWRGFTIVEVLVVLAVLSVLAAALLPLAQVSVKRSKERELKAALWEIRGALDAYKNAVDEGRVLKIAGSSGYPATLDTLVAGSVTADARTRLYFLRRIPADPFAAEDAQLSWAVRSYASSADRPSPGSDVYDVYSQSTQIGLNGVPYAKW